MENPLSQNRPAQIKLLEYAGWFGVIALFLTATAFGVLEVHSSNDTWIGLAAGRQIFESPQFPKKDTFSYTSHGATWYNQNWLTHVAQYWLYKNVSQDSVVYFTWAMAAAVFALTGLATFYRTDSWLAAFLAAAAVGFGGRDFLSARPATTGYFCIAALWLIFCALDGQRGKRRWWPIVALLPLMLIWGNAHGSFVFAYGMVGMYIGHWVFMWIIGRPRFQSIMTGIGVSSTRFTVDRADANSRSLFAQTGGSLAPATLLQIIVLLGVSAVSVVLLILISPFGLENFTHGGKVAGSEVFRSVSEWTPPYTKVMSNYPPMARFWWLLGAVVVGMTTVWVVSLVASVAGGTVRREARSGPVLHTSLFDVAAIAIGLSMTLWARRFAPMFYIFAAPIFAAWIIMLSRSLTPKIREWARLGMMLATLPLTVGLGILTAQRAQRELNVPTIDRPNENLLEAVTRYDSTPHDALMFLKNNDLKLNLLTEWTQGGMAMFFAPNCRVFIDGRAQQVYTEEQYLNYFRVLVTEKTPEAEILRIINASNTDGVLIRVGQTASSVYKMLLRNRDWVWVLYSPTYGLFVKRGSEGLKRLRERIDAGTEWRPDTAEALATRANILTRSAPLDLQRAAEMWRSAIDKKIELGAYWYPSVVSSLVELKRTDEAIAYIQQQDARVRANTALRNDQKQVLLAALGRCYKAIEQRRNSSASKPSNDEGIETPEPDPGQP